MKSRLSSIAGAKLNLIGSRTEENRPRIQRATETDVELLFDKLSEPIGPDQDFEHRLPLRDPPQGNTLDEECTIGQGRMAYILNHFDAGILEIKLNHPQRVLMKICVALIRRGSYGGRHAGYSF